MSPENTHKLMGLYMEVLILGAILWYMVSASLTLQHLRKTAKENINHVLKYDT